MNHSTLLLCSSSCRRYATNCLTLVKDCDLDRFVSKLDPKSIPLSQSRIERRGSDLHISGYCDSLMDRYLNLPEFTSIFLELKATCLQNNPTSIHVNREDLLITAVASLSENDLYDLMFRGKLTLVHQEQVTNDLRLGDPIIVFDLDKNLIFRSLRNLEIVAGLVGINSLLQLVPEADFVLQKEQTHIIFSPSHSYVANVELVISIPHFEYFQTGVKVTSPILTVNRHTHVNGIWQGFVVRCSYYIRGEFLLNLDNTAIGGTLEAVHCPDNTIDLRITLPGGNERYDGHKMITYFVKNSDFGNLRNIGPETTLYQVNATSLRIISGQIVSGKLQGKMALCPRLGVSLTLNVEIQLPSMVIKGAAEPSSIEGLKLGDLIPDGIVEPLIRSDTRVKAVKFHSDMNGHRYQIEVYVVSEVSMVNNIVIKNVYFCLTRSVGGVTSTSFYGLGTGLNDTIDAEVRIVGYHRGGWILEGARRGDNCIEMVYNFLTSAARQLLVGIDPNMVSKEFSFRFKSKGRSLRLEVEATIKTRECKILYSHTGIDSRETLKFIGYRNIRELVNRADAVYTIDHNQCTVHFP